MHPVQKALWYVESHFAQGISLDDIAKASGVSRYYITRSFGLATGYSIMRYVRGRRLTEAARVLLNGAPEILDVALEAGYGSHEAFTRAFREHFGLTPEAVREQRNLANLQLVEPIRMNQQPVANLAAPRIESGRALLIAGLNERYSCETSAAVPAQWQRFLPHLGRVPGQVGATAYGLNYNADEAGNFDYLCGVEVADFSALPPEFARVRVPAQTYVVFSHGEHISSIRRTWAAIWDEWLPESGREVADAPMFERYGEGFDSQTGFGGLEIWIPIVT